MQCVVAGVMGCAVGRKPKELMWNCFLRARAYSALWKAGSPVVASFDRVDLGKSP